MIEQALQQILARPQLDTAALAEIARLKPKTPLQEKKVLVHLDRRIGPKRLESTTLTVEDVVRVASGPRVTPRMRGLLDRFAIALFFARRPGVFDNPEVQARLLGATAIGAPGMPAIAHLCRTSPEIGLLFRAALHYAAGDVEVAYQLFAMAREAHPAGRPIVSLHNGLHVAHPLSRLAELAARPAHGGRELRIPGKGDFARRQPIVVFGVDQAYFDLYASRLVETGRGRVNFHFHIANPTREPGLEGPDIRYSFETAPDERGYYATMRLLHLPALLRHYGEPLIVSDADSYFTRGLDAYREQFDGHDVGLNRHRRAPGQFFWRRFTAGLVAATPSEASLAFWSRFAALFDALYRPGEENWWLDQALLAHTVHLAETEGPPVRLFDNRFGQLTGIRQDKLPASV